MSSKSKKIEAFDPGGVGQSNANIFGLPFTYEESDLILIPAPVDLTCSYRAGTSNGPQAIFEASPQIDFGHPELSEIWKRGIWMDASNAEMIALNKEGRKHAKRHIDKLENGYSDGDLAALTEANKFHQKLQVMLEEACLKALNNNKIIGLIGGEHSCTLPALKAISTLKQPFGLVQFDAHLDLRSAYEGFKFSHASIIENSLQIDEISGVYSIGIRDYSSEEMKKAKSLGKRHFILSDRELSHSKFMEKQLWYSMVMDFVKSLPQDVYITFDIDVLSPEFCPNTGTPVPGGLSYNEIEFILYNIYKAGKRILGFDLVEVNPGRGFKEKSDFYSWDAVVGMRILYLLSGYTLLSQSVQTDE